MKALELIKNQESIFLEEVDNKKVKNLVNAFNSCVAEMNNAIADFEAYSSSEKNGEEYSKIVFAKSLAQFFANNKMLKVENALANLETNEKVKISSFYAVKNKLLDAIKAIIKESQKDAFVCNFDIFDGDFQKCPAGHEIVILGGRNTAVLESLVEQLDESLVVFGNFENIEPQTVDYNLDTLNRNVELCNRKNNEMYGSKPGKLAKVEQIINKLKEVGERVVAFYTYKDALVSIGCNPKGIHDYENDLSKNYMPLKKALQKEFRIELEDICSVQVNEDEFPTANIDEETATNFGNVSSTEDSTQNLSEPVDNSTFASTINTQPESNFYPSDNATSSEQNDATDTTNNADGTQNTYEQPDPLDSLNNRFSSLNSAINSSNQNDNGDNNNF